jgi:hypothetical protein
VAPGSRRSPWPSCCQPLALPGSGLSSERALWIGPMSERPVNPSSFSRMSPPSSPSDLTRRTSPSARVPSGSACRLSEPAMTTSSSGSTRLRTRWWPGSGWKGTSRNSPRARAESGAPGLASPVATSAPPWSGSTPPRMRSWRRSLTLAVRWQWAVELCGRSIAREPVLVQLGAACFGSTRRPTRSRPGSPLAWPPGTSSSARVRVGAAPGTRAR